MEPASAKRLIQGAIQGARGTWADLGCGDGTFTVALAELLGPGSRIFALDRDTEALSRLRRRARDRPEIIPVEGDFTEPSALPESSGKLDGVLFANSMHFIQSPEGVLKRWISRLRPGGRVVLVEYSRRAESRWVPYPIPPERLEEIARSVGLSTPVIVGRRASAFSGTLYAAELHAPD